jgi:3-hydroxyacyl-CoA dehydrogenase/enoyl-CoA hydratase/3-hydroxybutyryl-CoA epimerase
MMRTLSLERREDGVAVVTIDTPNSSINILSSELFDEFRAVLDSIEGDASIVAAVLASGKRDNFIAGANVKEFLSFERADQGAELSRNGHQLLDRIAAGRKPVVAAIHGLTLGGGLEVALACHYRLATDSPKTVFGLPEVTLGLLPGAGGTQRLPVLVGLRAALPMLLTGQRVRAQRALRMGLVDAIASPGGLVETAATAAARLARGELYRRQPARKFLDRILELPLVRDQVLHHAQVAAARKTRGLYPAPPAILECVAAAWKGNGPARESELFGALCASPESKSLVRLFLATTELKKPRSEAEPRRIERLGVLGGGFMGAGICGVSLEHVPTIVKDISPQALGRCARAVDEGIEKRVKSGSLTRLAGDRQRSRLTLTTRYEDLQRCDLVIEAVFEDLELKRRVLADVEACVGEQTVFASNTSALPIGEIATGARRPECVVGMHYFSPVHRMPLLEVIAAEHSADWAVETARVFGMRQGKTVIVVRDGPGFYTTRILAPFLNEAMVLLEEGADIEELDRSIKDFGYPVGPIALLDEVGIDVGAHVSAHLGAAFADRGMDSSHALEVLAAAGYAGRKNGRGFYKYPPPGSRARKQVNTDIYRFFGGSRRSGVGRADAMARLSLLMVNEAVHCLQEGIIASPIDGDAGAVLGLGFPPFRGGPFHYVDCVGAGHVVDWLEVLQKRLGQRFAPAQLLVDKARNGGTFH